jgi:hypothetical protein
MSEGITCYRCGYCGNITDSKGYVLSIEDAEELLKLDVDIDKAEMTHGECCVNEQESNMVQATREMAMDAQDMRLKGQWYE